MKITIKRAFIFLYAAALLAIAVFVLICVLGSPTPSEYATSFRDAYRYQSKTRSEAVEKDVRSFFEKQDFGGTQISVRCSFSGYDTIYILNHGEPEGYEKWYFDWLPYLGYLHITLNITNPKAGEDEKYQEYFRQIQENFSTKKYPFPVVFDELGIGEPAINELV